MQELYTTLRCTMYFRTHTGHIGHPGSFPSYSLTKHKHLAAAPSHRRLVQVFKLWPKIETVDLISKYTEQRSNC